MSKPTGLCPKELHSMEDAYYHARDNVWLCRICRRITRRGNYQQAKAKKALIPPPPAIKWPDYDNEK